MKFVTSMIQGKTATLEEGPAKYRSTKEYCVLHRDESRTNCGKFVQILKVILCIELIILIGWLGYVSISHYNTDRNTDCAVSTITGGESYDPQPNEDSIPTRNHRYVVKRSVTTEPVPESMSAKCWSEEDDKILKEEREERMDAFVFRLMEKQEEHSYTKAYLKSIETALNATSVSEINLVQYPRKSHIHKYIESLSENSSLELRKEGCEINRDLHLEFYKLKNHSPEWNGYTQDLIRDNLTANHFFAVFTKEALFNDVVKFSNAFNLRYEELGNRGSGEELTKPVFGKFTYAREEPEKLGIRHLRHILDAFVKFYFKTQEPSSVCKGETPTADPAPEPTNAKCWNVEQDPALLEERRERLNAYTILNERHEAENLFTKNYLDAIQKALNAASASQIHFDDNLVRSAPLLGLIEYFAINASLEVHKEAVEIARDLYLEIEELKDHTSEWEGYNFNTIVNNLTENSKSDDRKTIPRTVFEDFTNFERAFNLHYEDLHADKPVLIKATYRGEEPEKLGVRHIRHILDGVVRFYFKVQHPSIAPVCNSSGEGSGNTNTGPAL